MAFSISTMFWAFLERRITSMTEQEATELIATKLMGLKQRFIGAEQTISRGLQPLVSGPGAYYDGDTFIAYIDLFTPFHDSNHARMVKDAVEKKGDGFLCKYMKFLYQRLRPFHNENVKNMFLMNNAPNPECMWSVVDALKEVEK